MLGHKNAKKKKKKAYSGGSGHAKQADYPGRRTEVNSSSSGREGQLEEFATKLHFAKAL